MKPLGFSPSAKAALLLAVAACSACCLLSVSGQEKNWSDAGAGGQASPPVALLLAGQVVDQGFFFGYGLSDGIGPDGGCAGATEFVDGCCYVPPSPPITGQTGPPGYNPDGGPDFTDLNLGTLSLEDATSNQILTTDSYGFVHVGLGYAVGYSNFGLDTRWSPGDLLTVSAMGGDAGGFTVSAPAVSAPVVALPTTISRSSSLALDWTPNSNPATFELRLDVDGTQPPVQAAGAIACAVPDSAGSLTIDASLLSHFTAGATGYLTYIREATASTDTDLGRVQFSTIAGPLGFSTTTIGP
jgi:hypothetical protein